ncbi:hypothetical protein [Actinomadura rudentiformis]|uniref:Head-tail adaptor protein n=1 Tax=Actinomadura rudentiformis TaxID=359158 RepID=A0A6H9YVZ0_9ACTN|nr:hypothetical protein [Actinomadura rudentiformis]KAB2344876.1 hypothetical protein F8566_30265 [Actinomadura rudentiformis]
MGNPVGAVMGLLAATLGPDSLTVIQPGPTDAHGDPAGPDARALVAGCQVQPAGSTENNDSGDTVTTRMRVYAPAYAPVTATSRIEWNTLPWDVEGEPQVWPGPTGAPHHMEFVIVRTTG